tara:strand:- start:40 stop:225 length:186 start_codon:yes stop_codon:yes gene_type:complete
MIGAPVHTHKFNPKKKRCFSCMGKGEYQIKISNGKSLGPYKCQTCKGTGKIKKPKDERASS